MSEAKKPAPMSMSSKDFCSRYTPPSLMNRGNTCFASAFLQLLGCTREFIDKLRRIDQNFVLVRMFSVTPRPILNGAANEVRDNKMARMKHHHRVNDAFKELLRGCDGSQQDAHEFALAFLNWMREMTPEVHIKHATFARITDVALNLCLKVTRTCSNCARVTQGCDENHICMSLPLAATLQESLQSYLTSTVDMRCDASEGGCGVMCEHLWRREPTEKMPRYLLLHLTRFQWFPNPTKLGSPVRIPHRIDLGNAVYTLKGFLVHTGSLSRGHYVSYVRTCGAKWFLCNDHTIKAVKPIAMLRHLPGAYMVLYSKKSGMAAEA